MTLIPTVTVRQLRLLDRHFVADVKAIKAQIDSVTPIDWDKEYGDLIPLDEIGSFYQLRWSWLLLQARVTQHINLAFPTMLIIVQNGCVKHLHMYCGITDK